MPKTNRRRNERNVILEDVRIVFRNFSGREEKFNAAGSRKFTIELDPQTADAMKADGWNVRYLMPYEEGDDATPILDVKLKYGGRRPPRVIQITSRNRVELDEGMVDLLDNADILQADLIIRPYEWDINGKTGVTAYLEELYVTIEENPLQKKYDNHFESQSEEAPF